MPTFFKIGALIGCVLMFAPGIALEAQVNAVEEARQARLGGEPQQAVEMLRTALASGTNVELEAELALALLSAGQPDDALAIAEKAVVAAPANASAARALALTLSASYEGARAIEVLDSALVKHPGNGALLAAKGRVLWELRRTTSAIEILRQALKDRTSAAEASYWLGRIYHFKGWQGEGAFPGWHDEPEYRDQAESAFRVAAAASPEWYAPLVGLGIRCWRATGPLMPWWLSMEPFRAGRMSRPLAWDGGARSRR